MSSFHRRLAPALALAILSSASDSSATDGVLEINQAAALSGGVTAGDSPGFPVELFTGGSYRLTSDLVVPSGAPAGIAAYEAGTRIDLNGFAIRSGTTCSGTPPICAPTGTGVGIDASGASDVFVRNGRIAGFGVYGVSLFEGGRVDDLTVESNAQGGIVCEQACIVNTSSVRRNGGAGVTVGSGSRISESTILGNAGAGVAGPADILSDRNLMTQNGTGSATLRERRFYISTTLVLGNAASTACSPGFHLASLWEIFDPSHLSYDRSLGLVRSNAGAGPPSGPRELGSYGWVRGSIDCNNWSTTTGSGFAAVLDFEWLSPTGTWPWYIAYLPCTTPSPVWCVED